MKAIYLGSKYKLLDKNGEKLEYALNVYKSKGIPLYEMHDDNGNIIKQCIYEP